jgi:N-acetylneuraminic acid mutarotase
MVTDRSALAALLIAAGAAIILLLGLMGSSTPGSPGVYGAQGVAAASNVPGARFSANSWIDSSGKLWLFGGQGVDSMGTAGLLNDLWMYDTNAGQWVWCSGSNTRSSPGVYGARGSASVSNAPGARHFGNSWIDSSGNLWLFGGVGFAGTGAANPLNDLWRFTPAP